MKRFGLAAVALAAVTAQAVSLAPLDSRNGFGDLEFGTAATQIQGLLDWGQQEGLEVYVAEMGLEVAGIRFETRMLRFWTDRLVQIQLLTTDLRASRQYFQLMAETYGRPTTKTGANSYEWVGRQVSASYGEDGKTATITYASVPLLREWQRKRPKQR